MQYILRFEGAFRNDRDMDRFENSGEVREALKFLFSPEGALFRSFLLDEIVKSIDALSREQTRQLVNSLGLQDVRIPNLMPLAEKPMLPLAPEVTEHDRQVIQNVETVLRFLLKDSNFIVSSDLRTSFRRNQSLLQDFGPVLPAIMREIVPEVSERLVSRLSARILRDIMT